MTEPVPQYDADLIRARYGRVHLVSPKPLIAAAAVVAVVGAGLLVWIGLGLAAPQATSKVISFNVVSSELTTVQFEVTKPIDRTAECTVEALSTGFTQVGVKTVTIGPSQTLTTQVFEEIKTSEIATTVIIDRCILAE